MAKLFGRSARENLVKKFNKTLMRIFQIWIRIQNFQLNARLLEIGLINTRSYSDKVRAMEVSDSPLSFSFRKFSSQRFFTSTFSVQRLLIFFVDRKWQ